MVINIIATVKYFHLFSKIKYIFRVYEILFENGYISLSKTKIKTHLMDLATKKTCIKYCN